MSEAEYGEVRKRSFWTIFCGFAGGWLLIVLSLAFLPSGISAYADAASFQIVAGTLLMVSFVFLLKKSSAAFEIWLALGIPVGLLGGNIGVSGMVLQISDPNAVGPASAVLMLTGLYGALFSASGYFALGKLQKPLDMKITGKQLTLILIGCGVIWVLPMAQGLGLEAYWSLPALILYLGFVVMAIFMNTDKNKSLVHCVSDAALAGILVSLVAALVGWFQSSPQVDITAVAFGSISVMYGTIIYIVCYIVSLWTGDTDQINFRVKNWHLVEANTFYIFLVFAPVNLGESMFNELEEVERIKMVEQQDSMRSEISVLTERLAKLEGS